jgi:hypothetical protein
MNNICCGLSHLGSFALHQPVYTFAQFIDVRERRLEPMPNRTKDLPDRERLALRFERFKLAA